jgi:hypothetical protein
MALFCENYELKDMLFVNQYVSGPAKTQKFSTVVYEMSMVPH